MTKTEQDKLTLDGKQDELEMKTYRSQTGEFEVKEVDIDNRTFEADVGAMGNLDRGDDVIEPGAFKKTISEKVPTGKVKLLDHHNKDSMRDLLGRVLEASEVPVTGQKASHALRALHKMSRRNEAEELLKDVEDNIADAMSIGFKPVKVEFELKDGVEEDISPKIAWYHGKGIRRIKEAEWWESSLVIWGMNPEASPLPNTVKSFFDKLEKMDERDLEEASEQDVLSLMKSLRDTLREAEIDAGILQHEELAGVTSRLGTMLEELDGKADVDTTHTSALADVFDRFREQKDSVENTPELVMWFGDEITNAVDDMDSKECNCVECGRSISGIVAFKSNNYDVCPGCVGAEEKADLSGARDPGDIQFDTTEESPDWGDVDLSLDAFVSAYGTEDEQGSSVGDLSQDTKTAIAARTAKGNADADEVDGLISYPIVNPNTDNLNLNGLQAANSRAGAEDDGAVQDTVETLMDRHFDEGDDNEEDALMINIDGKEISVEAAEKYIAVTGSLDSDEDNYAGSFMKALIDDMEEDASDVIDEIAEKTEIDADTVQTDIEEDGVPAQDRLEEYAGVLDVEPDILVEFGQASDSEVDSDESLETKLEAAGIDLADEGELSSLKDLVSDKIGELEEDGTSQDAGDTDPDEPGSTKENDSEDGDSDEHLEEKDAVDEEAREAAGEMLEELEGIEI